MTTLADMRPEQRAQCLGMWVDFTPPEWSDEPSGKAVGVLIGISGSQAVVVYPKYGIDEDVDLPSGHVDLDCIVPRGDLPRAWQPDGAPVKGYWEYESDHIIGHGGRTVRTLTSRRFVGEWEGEWEEA